MPSSRWRTAVEKPATQLRRVKFHDEARRISLPAMRLRGLHNSSPTVARRVSAVPVGQVQGTSRLA
jgi:hypothetical protein